MAHQQDAQCINPAASISPLRMQQRQRGPGNGAKADDDQMSGERDLMFHALSPEDTVIGAMKYRSWSDGYCQLRR